MVKTAVFRIRIKHQNTERQDGFVKINPNFDTYVRLDECSRCGRRRRLRAESRSQITNRLPRTVFVLAFRRHSKTLITTDTAVTGYRRRDSLRVAVRYRSPPGRKAQRAPTRRTTVLRRASVFRRGNGGFENCTVSVSSSCVPRDPQRGNDTRKKYTSERQHAHATRVFSVRRRSNV